MAFIKATNCGTVVLRNNTTVSDHPIDLLEAEGVGSIHAESNRAFVGQLRVVFREEVSLLGPGDREGLAASITAESASSERLLPRTWALARQILGVGADVAAIVQLIRNFFAD